jgi:hypothetical protein
MAVSIYDLSDASACRFAEKLWLQRAATLILVMSWILAMRPANASAGTAYTTQAFDNAHSNWNPAETQLTVASVRSNFRWLFKQSLNGQVFAQPLYLPNLAMGTLGTHNVIFIATETNTVYAFDADTPQLPLWSVNLTPSGETLQNSYDYQNSRVPNIGITGTPVIDTTSNTIYMVAASKTTSTPPTYHQRLHALDVTTGKERSNSPVDMQAKYPGSGGIQDGHGNVVFDPKWQFNRGGLLLFNGLVYTVWGSHEDNPTYQGWVIAYNKTTLQQAGVYNTSPNAPNGDGSASIWQASVGLVADSNSVYFATANGILDTNTGGPDYGDSAIRLGTNFQALDYFTPCNQQELSDLDVDLGSGAPMVLPTQSSGSHTQLLTLAGKEGSIYLVDRTNMGKYTPTTVPDTQECHDNVVQELWRVLGAGPTNGNANRDAYWGAPAYFQDSLGNQTVYYSGSGSGVRAYTLASGALHPAIINGNADKTPDVYPNGGTIPTVSSNGGAAGSAILWAIKRANSADGYGPLSLEAYNAANLTNQIVTDMPAGPWNKDSFAFLIPTVVNGKVYVAADGELNIFGISPTTTSTVKITSPANGTNVSGTVTITAQASSAVQWVNFYIDGAYYNSGPPYSVSWNSASVTNGQHTISVRAYASGGSQIGSDSVTVNVNNVSSSVVKLTSPGTGTNVSGTVTITAQASSAVLWVNFYIDGGYYNSGPPYSVSWNSASVANGQHTISMRAYASGGSQIGSDSVTVSVAN